MPADGRWDLTWRFERVKIHLSSHVVHIIIMKIRLPLKSTFHIHGSKRKVIVK